ncbi:hypothetical protein D9M68_903970 [compost metagenome]
MGTVGAEGRFIAGIGFEEGPDRAVALDGPACLGEVQEKVANHRKLAAQVMEVEIVEAIERLEKWLRTLGHADGQSWMGLGLKRLECWFQR